MGLSLNDVSVALFLLNDKLGLSFFEDVLFVLLLLKVESLGDVKDRLILVGLTGDFSLFAWISPFVLDANEALKVCFAELGERNDSSSRLLLVRVKSLGEIIWVSLADDDGGCCLLLWFFVCDFETAFKAL